MASQNANAVAITGGNVSANLTVLNTTNAKRNLFDIQLTPCSGWIHPNSTGKCDCGQSSLLRSIKNGISTRIQSRWWRCFGRRGPVAQRNLGFCQRSSRMTFKRLKLICPKNDVSKSDIDSRLDKIDQVLERIFDKLDAKADK
jgi:hypothetical protein